MYESGLSHFYSASLIINNKVISLGIHSNAHQAHKAIRSRLKLKIRQGSLQKESVVQIIVKDASGYFENCPEVFKGYFNKKLLVSSYL